MHEIKATIRNWVFQVRDIHVTAQATLSTGTPTAFLSGDTAKFLDLLHVTLANNSTVAANVVLKDDGSSAKTFQVPANSTLIVDLSSLPLFQSLKGSNWQLDMEDITGTTIQADALFVKN